MKNFALMDKSMGKHSPKYVTKEDLELYKITFSKPGALTPPINYYRQEVMNPSHLEIKKPVKSDLKGLFILGGKDNAISAGCVPLMKEKYKGLKVEIMKDAYHFIQQENPVEVNNLLTAFLRK